MDTIFIITDRIVVDRQLQDAVLSLEHKEGLIKVMDDKCSSSDLADALNGNTKIIVTTVQKFMYIKELVDNLREKKFALIIDEDTPLHLIVLWNQCLIISHHLSL